MPNIRAASPVWPGCALKPCLLHCTYSERQRQTAAHSLLHNALPLQPTAALASSAPTLHRSGRRGRAACQRRYPDHLHRPDSTGIDHAGQGTPVAGRCRHLRNAAGPVRKSPAVQTRCRQRRHGAGAAAQTDRCPHCPAGAGGRRQRGIAGAESATQGSGPTAQRAGLRAQARQAAVHGGQADHGQHRENPHPAVQRADRPQGGVPAVAFAVETVCRASADRSATHCGPDTPGPYQL